MKTHLLVALALAGSCKDSPARSPVTVPDPAAPARPAAAATSSPAENLVTPFDLEARAFELARLFPGATIEHDFTRKVVTIKSGTVVRAVINLVPGTTRVASVTLPVKLPFGDFARKHPRATCIAALRDNELRCAPHAGIAVLVSDFTVDLPHESNDDSLEDVQNYSLPIEKVSGREIYSIEWHPVNEPSLHMEPDLELLYEEDGNDDAT